MYCLYMCNRTDPGVIPSPDAEELKSKISPEYVAYVGYNQRNQQSGRDVERYYSIDKFRLVDMERET